ncbi:MAG: hypothetical protein LBU69_02640 [Deltaproteobacteria bacterium]|jgi:hypothetical protein|nr:hypothetical protein [Deltaproteobacteria bacterium]
MDSIEVRKNDPDYYYTTEQYRDKDTSKYVDENGNDLRFGFYARVGDECKFFKDSNYLITLKKDGIWNKLDHFGHYYGLQL